MALTEANVIKVAQMIAQTPINVQAQLDYMGVKFTSAKQTEVERLIALWDAGAGTNYTYIEPNGQNYGARISPESAKTDIKDGIAYIMERPDWAGSGGGMTSRYQRG